MEKIKLLREKSGAGMVECKTALDEAGGDIDKAMEILRKKGIAKAAKRSDREAGEGLIKVGIDKTGKFGIAIEINSETDFVARSAKFVDFADEILSIAIERGIAELNALLSEKMGDGNSLGDNLNSLSGVIGEKIGIKRIEALDAPTVAAYAHPGGGLGVLVGIADPGREELARDIAMQVAASNPLFTYPEDVPAEILEKEKEIYREQLAKEGKNADMFEKILAGKIKKYYEESCLSNQEYIKDEKKKISDILDGSKITGFKRFSL